MAAHLEEFHISTLNLFPMAKNVKNSIDREWFDALFPGLVNDVVKENEKDQETRDAVGHMREVSSWLK